MATDPGTGADRPPTPPTAEASPPGPGRGSSGPSPRGGHTFQAPTGTRDFYPAELARLRYLQDAWWRTSINHGFEEVDGPTFEHLDLYTVKSGEGIVSELFSFERFGGEKKFALRPEFTPTLARLYAAKAASLPKPTKWFWMQNCFRAERPQRGRLREFCQWNCDIIGTDPGEPLAQARADAEVIACAVGMFEGLGLRPGDVRVRVSHRVTLTRLLSQSGVQAGAMAAAFDLLDQRAKLEAREFGARASALGIGIQAWESLARLSGERFAASETSFPDMFSVLDKKALLGATDDAHEFFGLRDFHYACHEVGLWPWIDYDFSIVRGLAYYTGMVFEVHEASGAERAIAGGGRYDKLIEMFGGPPTPAVGFGMGDVVLSLVLQDKGLMPSDDEIAGRLGLRPDVFVVSNGQAESESQIGPVLARLRREGLHARRSYKTTKNVGKLIQEAVKARARFVYIVEGAGVGQLKDLGTQEQKAASVEEVVGRAKAGRG